MTELHIFSDASVLTIPKKDRDAVKERMRKDNKDFIFSVCSYSAFVGVLDQSKKGSKLNLEQDKSKDYIEQYMLTGNINNVSIIEGEILGLSLGLLAFPDLSSYDVKIFTDSNHIMKVLYKFAIKDSSAPSIESNEREPFVFEDQIKNIYNRLQQANSFEISHVHSHENTYYNNLTDGVSLDIAQSLYRQNIKPYLK